MNNKFLSIVWLRRDLRLDDNISLSSAFNMSGLIQPVFIFDTDILQNFPNIQDKRLSFVAEAICNIANKLRAKGGRLLVLHGRAKELIPRLAISLKTQYIFAGKDYEPYCKERDLHIENCLKQYDIKLILQNDHLLITPEEILKPDGNPYKVFTPYSRAWHKRLNGQHLQYYATPLSGSYVNSDLALEPDLNLLDLSNGPEFLLEQIGYKYSPSLQWHTDKAKKNLELLIDSKIQDYKEKRDFVYQEGTSRLSPYLRFGLISIRQCYNATSDKLGSGSWINELIWRDFYTSILHYFPDTINHEFIPKYRNLKWNINNDYLVKWQEGLTGFPIIDAAMRQLKQEGWMHNRARMIVASFFTKDLLLDWRLGEKHFSQLLMDYELSSNLGGWQWAASVGTDAQPYFRIFNPLTQSKNFDPEGIYIKKYIPELRDVSVKFIHDPKKYLTSLSYPDPIIDHAGARLKALKFFKHL